MLNGPVPAQGEDRYRYPPVFAQLVSPIAVLPAPLGLASWSALQLALVWVGVWLVVGVGDRRTRLLWSGAVITLFLPVFAMIWTGNADSPHVLAVGAVLAGVTGGARARALSLAVGASLAVAAAIKLTPLALMPVVLGRGGRVAIAAVATLGALAGLSLVLAPSAWAEYAKVLPNLLTGEVRYDNNLAPAVVLLNAGAPVLLTDLVRAAALVMAAVLIATSIVLASRTGTWPAAVACAVSAGLLAPAVLWYHYLVVLLPLAAFTWMRTGPGGRAVLLASGAMVSAGLALPPLATLGAASLATSCLIGLWPRARSVQPRGGAAQVTS